MPAKALSLFVVLVLGGWGVAEGTGEGLGAAFADEDARAVRTVAVLTDEEESVGPFALVVVVCFGPLLTTRAPPDVFAFPMVQLATQNLDGALDGVVVVCF